MNRAIAINSESARHFLDQRADFQAARVGPIVRIMNNGLKSRKECPPLLKTSPPHQMPQTSTDAIQRPEASLALNSALSDKQIHLRFISESGLRMIFQRTAFSYQSFQKDFLRQVRRMKIGCVSKNVFPRLILSNLRAEVITFRCSTKYK